jgi:hypothetical protein
LKQQTAEQQKRVEVMNDYIAAIKRMQRAREDATSKANFNAGDSPFAFLFGQTVQGGERASDDARENLKKQNEKLLKELDEEKQKVADKIRQRKEALSADLSAPVVTASGTAIPAQSRIVGNDSVLADLEKSARLIGEKSAAIRKSIDDTNAATENLIGRQVFTRVASLVGEKFVGAFDAAGAAIDRYLKKLPELHSATSQGLTQLAGPLGKLQGQQFDFGMDLGKGLINQDEFNKLNFQAVSKAAGADFWKAMGEAISNGFGDFQAAVDPKLDGLISNVREHMRNILASFGIGPTLKVPDVPTAQPFRASFVGLQELSQRIESAASGGRDKTQDGILKATEATAKATESASKKLDKLFGPIGP